MYLHPTSSLSVRARQVRAFTLIELCLGLLVTSLVAAAVASFMLSVSKCWASSENVQSSAMRADQFTARLAAQLRDAKRIGYWQDASSGDPGLIYWRDANNDGIMTLNELGVMLYDSGKRNVYLFTRLPSQPDEEWFSSDITDPMVLNRFIMLSHDYAPMVRKVNAARLTVSNATSTSVAPSVQWDLDLAEIDGTVSAQTCVASLRGP